MIKLVVGSTYITRDNHEYEMTKGLNPGEFIGHRADGSQRLFRENGTQIGEWNKNNGHVKALV